MLVIICHIYVKVNRFYVKIYDIKFTYKRKTVSPIKASS